MPLGGPLMRVDTDAVHERLVAGKAWREVSVCAACPHTVVIDVTPRVAVLAVRNPEGQVDVVDGEGFVFAPSRHRRQACRWCAPGARTVTKDGVTAALQALGSLEPPCAAPCPGVSVSDGRPGQLPAQGQGRRSKTVVWGGAGDGDARPGSSRSFCRNPVRRSTSASRRRRSPADGAREPGVGVPEPTAPPLRCEGGAESRLGSAPVSGGARCGRWDASLGNGAIHPATRRTVG